MYEYNAIKAKVKKSKFLCHSVTLLCIHEKPNSGTKKTKKRVVKGIKGNYSSFFKWLDWLTGKKLLVVLTVTKVISQLQGFLR